MSTELIGICFCALLTQPVLPLIIGISKCWRRFERIRLLQPDGLTDQIKEHVVRCPLQLNTSGGHR